MYHYTPPEQDASRRRNNNLAPVVNFGADQQQGWDSSWEQHQQPQPQHASGAYNGGAAQQWQQQQQQWQQQQPQQQQQQQQWQYAAPTAQGAYSGQMQPGYSGQMQMQPGAYSGQMPPGSFSGQMDGYGGQMDGAAQAQAPAKAQGSSITRNISATLLGEGEGDEPPILEELDINFAHIVTKTKAVMWPRRSKLDATVINDSDFAGPVFFCIILGTLLLFVRAARAPPRAPARPRWPPG
eukprot:Transcript_1971.p1 GENE.Transcript_1971~~Transcript_1971.p1  ORF type:complete len:273 (+),score=92.91 Transcript_1971:105-821(+)